MHTKAWTNTLFAALLCVFCLPAYGFPYLAIVKTQGGEERLKSIASENILNQAWEEVIVIPLTQGIRGAINTLRAVFPSVQFRLATLADKKFFIGQEASNIFYAGWLINDTSQTPTFRAIIELYETILPLPPSQPADPTRNGNDISEIHGRHTHHTYD